MYLVVLNMRRILKAFELNAEADGHHDDQVQHGRRGDYQNKLPRFHAAFEDLEVFLGGEMLIVILIRAQSLEKLVIFWGLVASLALLFRDRCERARRTCLAPRAAFLQDRLF